MPSEEFQKATKFFADKGAKVRVAAALGIRGWRQAYWMWLILCQGVSEDVRNFLLDSERPIFRICITLAVIVALVDLEGAFWLSGGFVAAVALFALFRWLGFSKIRGQGLALFFFFFGAGLISPWVSLSPERFWWNSTQESEYLVGAEDSNMVRDTCSERITTGRLDSIFIQPEKDFGHLKVLEFVSAKGAGPKVLYSKRAQNLHGLGMYVFRHNLKPEQQAYWRGVLHSTASPITIEEWLTNQTIARREENLICFKTISYADTLKVRTLGWPPQALSFDKYDKDTMHRRQSLVHNIYLPSRKLPALRSIELIYYPPPFNGFAFLLEPLRGVLQSWRSSLWIPFMTGFIILSILNILGDEMVLRRLNL